MRQDNPLIAMKAWEESKSVVSIYFQYCSLRNEALPGMAKLFIVMCQRYLLKVC